MQTLADLRLPIASPVPARLAGHSLRLVDLVKGYGRHMAVDHVSLDVGRGEFLTLLGPSGSGKTTILMMLAGFVVPSAGRIEVDGHDITAAPPEKRNFGVVFQGYALFPHMRVRENIAYPLKVRGLAKVEIARKVEAALALVRLEAFAERYPRELSGGQQQRVAIARALVFDPDLVLFDEPLGALDRKLRAEVQAEFKSLHRRLGVTFVYVTHDQDEALSMSDRIAVVNGGRIVQVGAPADLYERPRDRFVANFIGTSNCFAGRVYGTDGATVTIDVGKGRTIRHQGAAPRLGEGAWFALRPEKLRFAGGSDGAANRIPGTVRDVSYFGDHRHVSVATDALGPLAVTLPAGGGELPVPGSAATLAWDPRATVLLADPVPATGAH